MQCHVIFAWAEIGAPDAPPRLENGQKSLCQGEICRGLLIPQYSIQGSRRLVCDLLIYMAACPHLLGYDMWEIVELQNRTFIGFISYAIQYKPVPGFHRNGNQCFTYLITDRLFSPAGSVPRVIVAHNPNVILES